MIAAIYGSTNPHIYPPLRRKAGFLVVDHAPTCFRLNSSSTARNSDSSGESSNRLEVITTGSSRIDHRLISKIGPIESLPSVDQTEINN